MYVNYSWFDYASKPTLFTTYFQPRIFSGVAV